MSNLRDIARDNITCTRCGAKPGDHCVTKTGNRATWEHAARTWPAQNAWWEGYAEGTLEWAESIVAASREGGWDQLIARAGREASRARKELGI